MIFLSLFGLRLVKEVEKIRCKSIIKVEIIVLPELLINLDRVDS